MNRTTNFKDVRVTVKESVDITNQDDLIEADNPICTVNRDYSNVTCI